jgi:anthranilate synthase/aminodeoxychorismate synthase-like glutamine amidotransferase
MKLVFFDNYDSFTFNLVHYLREIGAEVVVIDQESALLHEFEDFQADALVVGPGPNSPSEAGPLLTYLSACMQKQVPVLGVCLGHQALGELMGLTLQKAQFPMHGKSSLLAHGSEDIFEGISSPMQVGRYHSLVVAEAQEKIENLKILMQDECGQIMAFRHSDKPFWGIQFHPESVLTPEGKNLLRSWIRKVDSML